MGVLITGATGFLGSYVLPLLTERYEVMLFARKPVKGFDAIYGDLSQRKMLRRQMLTSL